MRASRPLRLEASARCMNAADCSTQRVSIGNWFCPALPCPAMPGVAVRSRLLYGVHFGTQHISELLPEECLDFFLAARPQETVHASGKHVR